MSMDLNLIQSKKIEPDHDPEYISMVVSAYKGIISYNFINIFSNLDGYTTLAHNYLYTDSNVTIRVKNF